jgi:hypothetical protein
LTFPTMGAVYFTPKLWNGLIYPLNFAKLVKSPPRAFFERWFATVGFSTKFLLSELFKLITEK